MRDTVVIVLKSLLVLQRQGSILEELLILLASCTVLRHVVVLAGLLVLFSEGFVLKEL